MYVGSDQEKRMEVMEDLSLRELLALKEIHLTGQTSNKRLVRKFVEEEMIVDIEVDSLLLTQRWPRFPGQFGGLAKVDSGLGYAANFSCSMSIA
jgi:hypothetical protein